MNPKRQAFFVGLALAGIAIGYGLGVLSKNASRPEKTETAVRLSVQEAPPRPNPGTVRAYEEPLPKDIIENTVETGNGKALPTLKVTVETPHPVQEKTVLKAPPEETHTSAPEPAPVPKKPLGKPQAPSEQLAAIVPGPGPGAILKPAPKSIAKIAIVIDDLGIDKARTARTLELKGPLTLSFLAYAPGLASQTKAAGDAGHELWMHIPMEPGSPDIDPGPNVLLTGLPEKELRASVQWNLSQFSHYVGVNNHMGSRFTADLLGMRVVMQELKKRNLLFLDSITSGHSVARQVAGEIGVPFIGRNIFIDHLDETPEILKRLAEVERLAAKSGYAVAIGHPREKTLRAIGPWLDSLESRGFQLVRLSSLIKRH
ncbi:MAG: divergent polysaccharide deacetylase family protein [Rhodospirillales bacterium]|nr:divergent polysaccharide deacetylase family protein [Rhodospirillales bacterium]